mmetsp:Transcript_37257/g.119752  ORF Transcript_37257/g.119752 Transcript_37257/m.119752 type:complete len:139 (+) Transcript_37257:833-1249(+)
MSAVQKNASSPVPKLPTLREESETPNDDMVASPGHLQARVSPKSPGASRSATEAALLDAPPADGGETLSDCETDDRQPAVTAKRTSPDASGDQIEVAKKLRCTAEMPGSAATSGAAEVTKSLQGHALVCGSAATTRPC